MASTTKQCGFTENQEEWLNTDKASSSTTVKPIRSAESESWLEEASIPLGLIVAKVAADVAALKL